MTIADEIAKLATLRDQGSLTEAEFESQKKVLLNQGVAPAPAPIPVVNPEKARRAKALVVWSKVLGWGGLGTLFIIAPVLGYQVGTGLGVGVGALALCAAITGGVLGQVGRGMQGRVI